MDDPAVKRIVALIDMDCFYCQVELRLNPDLAGKPVAVVQYNQWKQGGIIAVNYEARDRGVTRFMRGEEAKRICPELCLPSVPSVRGKADLTRYRNAGVEVANVFKQFSDCVERASVDEAYIDLTSTIEKRILEGNAIITPDKLPSTFVVGFSDCQNNDMVKRAVGTTDWIKQLQNNQDSTNPDYRLAIGALIVEEIRSEVFKKTGFHCSAGIGHNKILAKLVAGLHKPKCQTVIPHDNVPELYESVAIRKLRNLGGKFGKNVTETLNIAQMSELYEFSKDDLIAKFGAKNGTWLFNIARGIDYDPVTARLIADSIGCSKNFPGPTAIKTKEKLQHWLRDMAMEVSERLVLDQTQNSRRAKLLTITFKQSGVASSRSCPLSNYKVEIISRDAFEILQKMNLASQDSPAFHPPIEYLGISASKFSCIKNALTNFITEKNKSSNVAKGQDEQFDTVEESLSDPDDDNAMAKEPSQTNNRSRKSAKIEQKRPSIKTYFTQRVAMGETSGSSLSKKVEAVPATSMASKESSKDTDELQDPRLETGLVSSNNTETIIEPRTVSIKTYFTQRPAQNPQKKPSEDEEGRELSPDVQPEIPDSGQNGEESRDRPQEVSSREGTGSSASIQSFFARVIAKKDECQLQLSPVKPTVEGGPISDDPVQPSGSDVKEDEWWQTCSECNKRVHLNEYVEHMDYHEAVKVHHAINGKIQVKTAPPRPAKSKCIASPAKKKRKINMPVDQKAITNFFGVLPKT